MLADTSFLFALFVESDSNHLAALDMLQSLKTGIEIPSEIISELYSVLVYKFGFKPACFAVESILGDPLFRLIPYSVFEEVYPFVSHLGKKISYPDSLLVYHNQINGEKILTFDKQLKRILSSRK